MRQHAYDSLGPDLSRSSFSVRSATQAIVRDKGPSAILNMSIIVNEYFVTLAVTLFSRARSDSRVVEWCCLHHRFYPAAVGSLPLYGALCPGTL